MKLSTARYWFLANLALYAIALALPVWPQDDVPGIGALVMGWGTGDILPTLAWSANIFFFIGIAFSRWKNDTAVLLLSIASVLSLGAFGVTHNFEIFQGVTEVTPGPATFTWMGAIFSETARRWIIRSKGVIEPGPPQSGQQGSEEATF